MISGAQLLATAAGRAVVVIQKQSIFSRAPTLVFVDLGACIEYTALINFRIEPVAQLPYPARCSAR